MVLWIVLLALHFSIPLSNLRRSQIKQCFPANIYNNPHSKTMKVFLAWDVPWFGLPGFQGKECNTPSHPIAGLVTFLFNYCTLILFFFNLKRLTRNVIQLIFSWILWDIFRRFYYSFIDNFFVLVAFLEQDRVFIAWNYKCVLNILGHSMRKCSFLKVRSPQG